MKNVRLVAVMTIVFLASGIRSEASQVDAFLRNNSDAKSAALGGSVLAARGGDSVIFWNPSCMADFKTYSIGGTTFSNIEARRLQLQVAIPYGNLHFGVGYTSVNQDGIKRTQVGETPGRGVVVGLFDSPLSVTYVAVAMPIEKWTLGASLKYFSATILNYKGSGIGADLGVNYNATPDLRFSGVVLNALPTKVKWNTPSGIEETMARTFGAGINLRLLDQKLEAQVDAYSNAGTVTYGAGAQYSLNPFLSIRGGIKPSGVTLGTGLKMDTLRLDFSWTASDNPEIISDTYRFSIGFDWDPSPTTASATTPPIQFEVLPATPSAHPELP